MSKYTVTEIRIRHKHAVNRWSYGIWGRQTGANALIYLGSNEFTYKTEWAARAAGLSHALAFPKIFALSPELQAEYQNQPTL